MEPLKQFFDALKIHNWYSAAALGLMVALQVVRQSPNTPLVSYLNKLWFKIPDGWRWLPSVAVGAFVGAFQAGASLGTALIAVLGGVLGISMPAMGMHAVAKESPLHVDGGAGGKPLQDRPSGVDDSEVPTSRL
jgi:hypothetical protein